MKSRSCQTCGAAFDRYDLVPFFFMRLGNTINCLRCVDLNYLIPNKNAAYRIVFCITAAFGLFIFSLAFKLLGFMGLHLGNIGIVGIIVGTALCIAGAIIGAGVSRFILKMWNWRNGELTLDDAQQSILDFG